MRHLVLGLWAVSMVLVACGDDGGGDGTTADAGDEKVTYGTGAAPDYAAVSAILGGPEQEGIGSCAAGSSCHGGDARGKADLNFKTATDIAMVLVDVPACENSALKRVKPGNPEESWIWIKLTAEIEDTKDGLIKHEGTPSSCSGVNTGFGTRMPQVLGSFEKLPKEKLDVIYDWIKGGAPGPKGTDAGSNDQKKDASTNDEDAAAGGDAG